MSIGGPPKAQLGSAGKNYCPVTKSPESATSAFRKIPRQALRTHPAFARTPVLQHLVLSQQDIHPPETTGHILSGRPAWDGAKKLTDERLENLGVDTGTNSRSSVPHVHAPHARAASVSHIVPVDPALLCFKLKKLQQAQNLQSHSASVLPQLPPHPINAATPPMLPVNPLPLPVAPVPPTILSLAATPFTLPHQYFSFNNTMFNPFGPGATLGSDAIREPDARSDPGARTDQSLAPPATPARAHGYPDFVRRFGLDVSEEADKDEEDQQANGGQELVGAAAAEEDRVLAGASHVATIDMDDMLGMELDADADANADIDADAADATVDRIATAASPNCSASGL
ncbi:hypothetical protein BC834DRAFT_974761 [Gloeopeniophorella convolvens]|nr:hypothetical protein BC834DRAFT_974761 [Gloeopeniophorella convolvens]